MSRNLDIIYRVAQDLNTLTYLSTDDSKYKKDKIHKKWVIQEIEKH